MKREEMLKEMIGFDLYFVPELFEDEEADILVEKQEGRQEDYQIYADRPDSEIYCVNIKKDENDRDIITAAW